MNKRFLFVMLILAVSALSFSVPLTAQETADAVGNQGDGLRVGQAVRWEGTIGTVTRHYEDRSRFEEAAIITLDDGRVYELDMPMSQAYALHNLRASVEGLATLTQSRFVDDGEVLAIDVTSARALEARAMLTDQEFFNVLCLLNGDPQPALASDPGYADFWTEPTYGMIKYWDDQSYGQFDMTGSGTANRWVTLPNGFNYYQGIYNDNVGTLGGLGAAAVLYTTYLNDCVDLLEASGTPNYDFSLYDGFNIMVNSNPWSGGSGTQPGSFSIGWSGGITISADGTNNKPIKATINIPFFHSVDVVGHEMGHTFGLRHTPGIATTNAAAGTFFSPYDSTWSIMSEGYVYANENCEGPSNDCRASGMIGYQVDQLGWIPANRKQVITDLSVTTTVTLEKLRDPAANSNLLYVEVPLSTPADEFLSIAVRVKEGDAIGSTGTNDYLIPGTGVVMHQIDENDNTDSVTVMIDGDNDNDVDDAGAYWTVGETYVDTANNLSVEVIDDPTSTSFTIRISSVAPENMAPDGDILTGPAPVIPTFTWDEAGSPATTYQIYLAPDSNISNAIFWAQGLAAADICESGSCSYTPDPADFDNLKDWGLTDRTYAWYLRYDGTWTSKINFSVDTPAPQIGTPITSAENSGRPTVFWGGDANTLFYQIWIGKVPADGSPVYNQWVTDVDAGCPGSTEFCEYDPNFNFGTGTYQVWMRGWGPDGYTLDDTPAAPNAPQWFLGEDLVFPNEPAGLPTGLSAAASDSNTVDMTWSAGDSTTYFYAYLTNDGPPYTEVYDSGWQLASDLGCELSGQTCTLSIDDLGFNMSDGSTYQLWVRAYGNGGFSTGGFNGSAYAKADFLYSVGVARN